MIFNILRLILASFEKNEKMVITWRFIIAFLFTVTFSQFSNGQYFAEVNYGVNGSISPTTNTFSHAGAGFGYMDRNSRLGVKLDLGLDQFRTTVRGKETGSDLYRFSAQAICDVSNLINERSYYNKFNLLVHTGMGLHLWPLLFQLANTKDHIINVIMGLTPKYQLTDKMALTFDASLIFNVGQSYQFDVDYSAPPTLLLNHSQELPTMPELAYCIPLMEIIIY